MGLKVPPGFLLHTPGDGSAPYTVEVLAGGSSMTDENGVRFSWDQRPAAQGGQVYRDQPPAAMGDTLEYGAPPAMDIRQYARNRSGVTETGTAEPTEAPPEP